MRSPRAISLPLRRVWSWILRGGGSPRHPSSPRLAVARLLLLFVAAIITWALLRHHGAFVEGSEELAALTKRPKPGHLLPVHLWIAGGINLGLVLALFFFTPRWAALPRPPCETPRASPSLTPAFLLLSLAVLALAASQRLPRLDHSLYGDEIYSITDFIHGEFREGRDGGTTFRPVAWEDTLWGYHRPNNHILYSIAARAAHETWQAATGAPEHALNTAVLRWPSLAAALLSIPLAMGLLWALGHRLAAIAAGLLLALHPWHITHSAEVRGYGFVFLLATAVAWCALRAMETGTWRWWAALAASQFLLLYTYPSALYVLGPLCLILFATLIRRRTTALDQIARLLVTHAVMAGALIQLLLPCLPQIRAYLGKGAPQGGISLPWIQDVGGYFLTGMAWHPWESGSEICHGLADRMAAHPLATGVMLSAFAGAGLLGFLSLRRRDRLLFLVILPFWLAPVIAVLQAWHSGTYLFTWYVVFSLPAWIICCAFGFVRFAELLPRRWPSTPVLRPALAGIAVLAFVGFTETQRATVRSRSKEPVMEMLADMRRLQRAGPGNGAFLASASRNLSFHAPDLPLIESRADLDRAREAAARENRRLVIGCNYLSSLKRRDAKLHADLMDPTRFQRLACYPGLEFAHRSCLLLIQVSPLDDANRLARSEGP